MGPSDGWLAYVADLSTGNYIVLASVVSVGIGIVFLRQLVSGGVCRSKARLDDKFVIITGANTGIGKETAKDLVLRGARVMLACRDPMKGAAAADDIFKTTGKKLAVKALDLSDLDSVRLFANGILEAEPRLDILINNAGIIMCPRLESKQGYELQFATNHLGHFLLTNLLLPLLKNSSTSRIIVVSSSIYRRGKVHFDDINHEQNYSPISAYAQSKLANILFTRELAKRLKGSGVTVNCLHPGVISTDLGRHIEARIPTILQLLIQPLIALVKFLAFKTVRQGAQTSIYCAVSEELEGVTGKYFSDCSETRLRPQATDDEVARRLWDISEEMVSLNSGPEASGDTTNKELDLEEPECDQLNPNSEDAIDEPDFAHVTEAVIPDTAVTEESFADSGSRQTTV